MPAKVHSGLFTHVISLETPVKATDEGGGNDEVTWTPFVTTRGYFRKRSGFRNLETGYDQLVKEYEVFTYWRSEFDNNITKDTRFVYDNVIYKIVDKERWEENRMFYRFTVIGVE